MEHDISKTPNNPFSSSYHPPFTLFNSEELPQMPLDYPFSVIPSSNLNVNTPSFGNPSLKSNNISLFSVDNFKFNQNENQINMSNPIKHLKPRENESRQFKCTQCDKAYLSYPALYTHIKTKHVINGEILANRTRGRPKKIIPEIVDPCSQAYLKVEGRSGGPIPLIYKLKELLFEINKRNNVKNEEYNIAYENHPMFNILNNLHMKCLSKFKYSPEFANILSQDNIQIFKTEDKQEQILDEKLNLANLKLSENCKKLRKNCDEVIGEFLLYVSTSVNSSFYSIVLKFCLLFRESLNILGPEIKPLKAEEGQILPLDNKIDDRKGKYSESHTAEFIPEICNDFVKNFIEEVDLKKSEVIELVLHFCHWLFLNGYTCTRLNLEKK